MNGGLACRGQVNVCRPLTGARCLALAIGRDRRRFRAVDISSARCMEVDFPTDLAEAESTFADLGPSRKG